MIKIIFEMLFIYPMATYIKKGNESESNIPPYILLNLLTLYFVSECRSYWPPTRVLSPHRLEELSCVEPVEFSLNIRELDKTWEDIGLGSIWGSSFKFERRVSMVFLKAILGQPDMLRTFFGSLLNSLAPWKGKELKRRLENLVFLRGLVWIVLPN